MYAGNVKVVFHFRVLLQNGKCIFFEDLKTPAYIFILKWKSTQKQFHQIQSCLWCRAHLGWDWIWLKSTKPATKSQMYAALQPKWMSEQREHPMIKSRRCVWCTSSRTKVMLWKWKSDVVKVKKSESEKVTLCLVHIQQDKRLLEEEDYVSENPVVNLSNKFSEEYNRFVNRMV